MLLHDVLYWATAFSYAMFVLSAYAPTGLRELLFSQPRRARNQVHCAPLSSYPPPTPRPDRVQSCASRCYPLLVPRFATIPSLATNTIANRGSEIGYGTANRGSEIGMVTGSGA
eukprot:703074-Rhodomonas_salina.1